MAGHFLPGLESLKRPFSLLESDPNVEFTSHFSGTNPGNPQPSSLNVHSWMGFSLENPFPHFPDAPGNSETFPGLFNHEDDCIVPPLAEQVSSNDKGRVDRKRKPTEVSTPANSPANSSPQCSDNGIRRKNSSGRGKRVKGNEKEKKLKEVVHVRAKRGQATDSHSLAERVRREKINERIRCLQDLVPGCYKTMGMAVMLDEIINYVQSLQNQVEFLSMRLTAASTFYDYNSETDALEALKRAKGLEALKNQNGAGPGLPSAQFAPLDLNFGYYPQLPQNS